MGVSGRPVGASAAGVALCGGGRDCVPSVWRRNAPTASRRLAPHQHTHPMCCPSAARVLVAYCFCGALRPKYNLLTPPKLTWKRTGVWVCGLVGMQVADGFTHTTDLAMALSCRVPVQGSDRPQLCWRRLRPPRRQRPRASDRKHPGGAAGHCNRSE
jgi:hypothetical protein